MTDHAIPPRELVEQWASEKCYDERDWLYELHIANRAAQWGADQELRAVCQLLFSDPSASYTLSDIRAARRPKPPSLKEQALQALGLLIPFIGDEDKRTEADTIRRALEQLPE